MRPQFSAAERFAKLKASVRGSWFTMPKLKKLIDKEIAEAGRKAARLRAEGNRYMADAELYQDALRAYELGLKESDPESLPASCQEEYQKQLKVSVEGPQDAFQTLIAINRRNWVRNKNDGGRYLQAATEWDYFAENLLTEFAKLDAEVMAHA